MRSIAGQRRGKRVFHRAGAAQPAVGELFDPREHVVEPIGLRDGQPARPPAGGQIRFRQRRKRNDRGVGIQRGDRRHGSVEREVGVNLVGEQRKVVLVGEIDQRRGAPPSSRSPRSDCSDR